ncbi:hypothetical protein TVAG_114800 [Trichomonas vaginalis G3]|uniref:Uncharacterized protein n=1 Tax=Trichomonas vaginalis (strain ATCC PRA-98 / G3) TaxID=412133 RepID=A2FGK3_TRIV3|nr:armadillo (ARM) repeat-containing protein family [Trichomonas vaginalis G3]EAX95969.1 hypothetical protein TVAG_114800 [Trichomonas vaginalis G3]KAI5540467.1 armadillo (ARM) repeat-containing protein family [Trichomonas vaginalis G3]|eukprot:XP_001308899.1 hypothetical protein [Trichomonas vaginalis G3]
MDDDYKDSDITKQVIHIFGNPINNTYNYRQQLDPIIPENFESLEARIPNLIKNVIEEFSLAKSIFDIVTYLSTPNLTSIEFEIPELKSKIMEILSLEKYPEAMHYTVKLVGQLWYFISPDSDSIWIDPEIARLLINSINVIDIRSLPYVYFSLSNYICLDEEFIPYFFTVDDLFFNKYKTIMRSYTSPQILTSGLLFLQKLLVYQNEDFYQIMTDLIPILRAHMKNMIPRVRLLSLACIHQLIQYPPAKEFSYQQGVPQVLLEYIRDAPYSFVSSAFDVICDYLESPVREFFINFDFLSSLIDILQRTYEGDYEDKEIGMIFAIFTNLQTHEQVLNFFEEKDIYGLAVNFIIQMSTFYKVPAAIFLALELENGHLNYRAKLIQNYRVFEALTLSLDLINDSNTASLIFTQVYVLLQENTQGYLPICFDNDVCDILNENSENYDEKTQKIIEEILKFIDERM